MNVVTFLTRPTARLGLAPPPPRPPALSNGDHCWRARCEVDDDDAGARMAAFVGHDVTLDISTRTEAACRRHAPIGSTCRPAQLVLLARGTTACSGQVVFVVDGRVTKIV